MSTRGVYLYKIVSVTSTTFTFRWTFLPRKKTLDLMIRELEWAIEKLLWVMCYRKDVSYLFEAILNIAPSLWKNNNCGTSLYFHPIWKVQSWKPKTNSKMLRRRDVGTGSESDWTRRARAGDIWWGKEGKVWERWVWRLRRMRRIGETHSDRMKRIIINKERNVNK